MSEKKLEATVGTVRLRAPEQDSGSHLCLVRGGSHDFPEDRGWSSVLKVHIGPNAILWDWIQHI